MSSSFLAYATLGFAVIFGLIVLWAYWPANRKKFEQDGQIPFDDGER